jgi:uncharacterized protein YndB with AHSA1/START domain
MDYSLLIKKLVLPDGFSPPARLVHEDIVATAITRADLHDDVRGINASLDLIRRTRGGDWPTEPLAEAINFVDLVWHEQEFRERTSLTYVLRDSGGGYLGCCYLYPMGRRTKLTEALLPYDVDVSWWVTSDAYQTGYYAKTHQALIHWLAKLFPFWDAYVSNNEIPSKQRSPLMKITVEKTVHAPIAKVWDAYTTPVDIKQWNAASDDWHTTKSSVDLRVGGVFSSRMEAKDGSFGFDFAGTYTKMVPQKLIEYTFGDRTGVVEFLPAQDGVTVRVTFDAEEQNPVEMQRGGWQAILDNFARHVEAKK